MACSVHNFSQCFVEGATFKDCLQVRRYGVLAKTATGKDYLLVRLHGVWAIAATVKNYLTVRMGALGYGV